MEVKRAKNALDVGIVTGNAGRLLDFYCDILGLRFLGSVTLPFGTVFRLEYGESLIKLLQPEEAQSSTETSLTGRVGFQYLTIEVENLEEVYREFQRLAIRIEMPLQTLSATLKAFMVRDPDANIVEIIERTLR